MNKRGKEARSCSLTISLHLSVHTWRSQTRPSAGDPDKG